MCVSHYLFIIYLNAVIHSLVLSHMCMCIVTYCHVLCIIYLYVYYYMLYFRIMSIICFSKLNVLVKDIYIFVNCMNIAESG